MLARASRRRWRALIPSPFVAPWNPPDRHSCQTGESSVPPSRRYVARTARSGCSSRSPSSSTSRFLRTGREPTTRRPAGAGLRRLRSAAAPLERGDAIRLVPGDADELRLCLDDAELGPRLGRRALAVQAPGRRRIPRETVHECTSCTGWEEPLSLTGAGARVIVMSPDTVLALISTSGPSPAGASVVSSSSELVSPLTVLQSR